MPTCPLLRIASTSQPMRRPTDRSRWCTLFAILLSMAGIVGWYGLRDMLNAIPDSNDDFTYH
ncbi:hypothetical protein [Paraburkholderia sp.]|uniref:hypothetical protein n=1 Tax=Paraburkholderia sp. TaxID=1926495 RepID=UPI003D700DA0